MTRSKYSLCDWLGILAMVVFLVGGLFAADPSTAPTSATAAAAPSTPAKSHPVPDAVRYKVLAGYQKAMRLQSEYQRLQLAACDAQPQCKDAREQLNSAITAYNTSMPEWVKEAGLGTNYALAVDEAKDTVTAVDQSSKADSKVPATPKQ